jgi:hypothetical protein
MASKAGQIEAKKKKRQSHCRLIHFNWVTLKKDKKKKKKKRKGPVQIWIRSAKKKVGFGTALGLIEVAESRALFELGFGLAGFWTFGSASVLFGSGLSERTITEIQTATTTTTTTTTHQYECV